MNASPDQLIERRVMLCLLIELIDGRSVTLQASTLKLARAHAKTVVAVAKRFGIPAPRSRILLKKVPSQPSTLWPSIAPEKP